jgi:hypothetical protein
MSGFVAINSRALAGQSSAGGTGGDPPRRPNKKVPGDKIVVPTPRKYKGKANIPNWLQFLIETANLAALPGGLGKIQLTPLGLYGILEMLREWADMTNNELGSGLEHFSHISLNGAFREIEWREEAPEIHLEKACFS